MDDELNPNIGGRIFINPGTGTVIDATENNATDNMRMFIDDSPISTELYFRRVPHLDYGYGRYAFLVLRNGHDRVIEIQMPGRELTRVRYMGRPNQDAFDFPKLYHDGHSDYWNVAIIDEDYYEEYEDE